MWRGRGELSRGGVELTSRGDVMRFSTARTTPSLVQIPIAVEPSCELITVVLLPGDASHGLVAVPRIGISPSRKRSSMLESQLTSKLSYYHL